LEALTIKIDEAMKHRLGLYAASSGQTADEVALRALEAFLAWQEEYEGPDRDELLRQAEESEREYAESGLLYDGPEVMSWLESLNSDSPKLEPEPHKS